MGGKDSKDPGGVERQEAAQLRSEGPLTSVVSELFKTYVCSTLLLALKCIRGDVRSHLCVTIQTVHELAGVPSERARAGPLCTVNTCFWLKEVGLIVLISRGGQS